MYELMVIGNPKVDSEAMLAVVDRALKEASATSIKMDRIGRKLLAYPIAKQTEGEYVLFNFEAGGEAIALISGKLKLAREMIIRYLITRVESDSTRVKEAKGTKVAEGTEETKVTTAQAVMQEPKVEEKKGKAKVKVRAKPKGK